MSHQVQSDDAERLKCLLHFLLSSLSMGWPYKGVWGALDGPMMLEHKLGSYLGWELDFGKMFRIQYTWRYVIFFANVKLHRVSTWGLSPNRCTANVVGITFFGGTTTFGFFVSVAAQLTVVHHLQRCLHEVCMLAILPFAVLYFHLHGLRRVTDLSSGVCYIHHIGYVCIDLQ